MNLPLLVVSFAVGVFGGWLRRKYRKLGWLFILVGFVGVLVAVFYPWE